MYDNLSNDTLTFLAPLREDIDRTMAMCRSPKMLPPENIVLQAFVDCPIERTRVVLYGQDPYIKAGEATGNSFSVRSGVKIPPSLKNIFMCLVKSGLASGVPATGDLTKWSNQGVLLLNMALTTEKGKSGAHLEHWREPAAKLARALAAARDHLIVILLGTKVQSLREYFVNHTVLTWGHPSPLNRDNGTNGPRSFINCDVFSKTNIILARMGKQVIDWDAQSHLNVDDIFVEATGTTKATETTIEPIKEIKMIEFLTFGEAQTDEPHVMEANMLWVFVDGASRANGKPDCRASWAFYVADLFARAAFAGIVQPPASNNRGELTAILAALNYITEHESMYVFDSITIVSDSQYSINSISKYASSWRENNVADRKNLDLIYAAHDKYTQLLAKYSVEFVHVRGHQAESVDEDEWFIWRGNKMADDMCAEVLKKYG